MPNITDSIGDAESAAANETAVLNVRHALLLIDFAISCSSRNVTAGST